MDLRSQVGLALQQLSQSLGRRLELDHNGTLGLEFEGGESCTIEAPSWADLVYLFAPVLQVEAAARAARLEWALAANLNEIALPGMFFALDRTSDSLFLVAPPNCRPGARCRAADFPFRAASAQEPGAADPCAISSPRTA